MDGENNNTRRRRLRREDPKRVGPIRNLQMLLRRSNSWNSRDPMSPGNDDKGGETHDRQWNETVAHGVKLGYSVIEEQIQQGQRIAQEINDRTYSAGAVEDNIGKLLERVMHFYTDVGSLCVELVESTLRNPAVSGIYSTPGAMDPGINVPQQGQRTNVSTGVSIEIASSQPTRVKLDLQPNANSSTLAVHELRALDPEMPPITDVGFELDQYNGPPKLRIVVPEGQPAAIYTGALVDRDTNEPQGTLSILIDK